MLSSTTNGMDAPSIRRFIQDNAGRKTFLKFFKQDCSLDLTIVNFGNITSHKYLVQKSKSSCLAMTAYSFLVLIQKWHKLYFENSSCKLLS